MARLDCLTERHLPGEGDLCRAYGGTQCPVIHIVVILFSRHGFRHVVEFQGRFFQVAAADFDFKWTPRGTYLRVAQADGLLLDFVKAVLGRVDVVITGMGGDKRFQLGVIVGALGASVVGIGSREQVCSGIFRSPVLAVEGHELSVKRVPGILRVIPEEVAPDIFQQLYLRHGAHSLVCRVRFRPAAVDVKYAVQRRVRQGGIECPVERMLQKRRVEDALPVVKRHKVLYPLAGREVEQGRVETRRGLAVCERRRIVGQRHGEQRPAARKRLVGKGLYLFEELVAAPEREVSCGFPADSRAAVVFVLVSSVRAAVKRGFECFQHPLGRGVGDCLSGFRHPLDSRSQRVGGNCCLGQGQAYQGVDRQRAVVGFECLLQVGLRGFLYFLRESEVGLRDLRR